MMSHEFIEEIIRGGIEGAKTSYANDQMRLEGALAGFEACRGKTPEQLATLLEEVGKNTTRAMLEQLPDYWRHRCFHAEIEWVCNCWSAVLVNEGTAPIITPTDRGVMRANEVLRGAS